MILYNLTQKLAVPIPAGLQRKSNSTPAKKSFVRMFAVDGDLLQFTWLVVSKVEKRVTFNLLHRNKHINYTQSIDACKELTEAEYKSNAEYCTKRLPDWTWKEP